MSRVPEGMRRELAELSARPDGAIAVSDLPASPARDSPCAVRGKFYRPVNRQLPVRIDADGLEWLKSQGGAYQTRLNEILRTAMLKGVR